MIMMEAIVGTSMVMAVVDLLRLRTSINGQAHVCHVWLRSPRERRRSHGSNLPGERDGLIDLLTRRG
jgi:hypothetical protein